MLVSRTVRLLSEVAAPRGVRTLSTAAEKMATGDKTSKVCIGGQVKEATKLPDWMENLLNTFLENLYNKQGSSLVQLMREGERSKSQQAYVLDYRSERA